VRQWPQVQALLCPRCADNALTTKLEPESSLIGERHDRRHEGCHVHRPQHPASRRRPRPPAPLSAPASHASQPASLGPLLRSPGHLGSLGWQGLPALDQPPTRCSGAMREVCFGSNPAVVRRRSPIVRPTHRTCVVSHRLCVRRLLPSQIICAGNGVLLRVGPYIIVRRYM
jgi:hypothetical protein